MPIRGWSISPTMSWLLTSSTCRKASKQIPCKMTAVSNHARHVLLKVVIHSLRWYSYMDALGPAAGLFQIRLTLRSFHSYTSTNNIMSSQASASSSRQALVARSVSSIGAMQDSDTGGITDLFNKLTAMVFYPQADKLTFFEKNLRMPAKTSSALAGDPVLS